MTENNRYFKLFEGEEVNESEIALDNPYMVKTVEALVARGKVIGQKTLEGEVIFWIPKRRINGGEML